MLKEQRRKKKSYHKVKRQFGVVCIYYLGTIDRGASSVLQGVILRYLFGSCLLETQFLGEF